MERLHLSNSLSAANAFVSTLFSHAGVKQAVGGTGLAMASIALMMAHALYGPSKLHLSVR
jgi:hypothetical protein